jgi:hypothetical protein
MGGACIIYSCDTTKAMFLSYLVEFRTVKLFLLTNFILSVSYVDITDIISRTGPREVRWYYLQRCVTEKSITFRITPKTRISLAWRLSERMKRSFDSSIILNKNEKFQIELNRMST